MHAYKYKGASYPLSFPRYYCVYLQNMTGHYELSPPPCVLLLPSPLPCERGVGGEQRKDSTVGFPFFSFYQPSEVKMLLAPLCVWARAVHLATESRSGRQQNSLATCVCACVRGGEGERERENGFNDVLCCRMQRVPLYKRAVHLQWWQLKVPVLRTPPAPTHRKQLECSAYCNF